MNRFILFLGLLILFSCKKKINYKEINGSALGTNMHVKIKDNSDHNWKKSIDSLIDLVNQSLSTYKKNSLISKINRGDTTTIIDNRFKEVFYKSKQIYKETNGIFDPTVGILVNAWDFGPEQKIKNLDSITVRNLMQQVGFNKVSIKKDKVVKEHPKIYIDFNAIAKGYGIDVIGRFIEQKKITDYMVEIGGEVRAKGKNSKNTYWKIGIENPNFDGTQSYSKIIYLQNESIATSGTYRKFKLDKKGNRYSHIINSKTGYPSKSNVLSASVIATTDCANVDAYATAFIAFGLDKSKEFLQKHKELKAFIIYVDDKGSLNVFKTDNLK